MTAGNPAPTRIGWKKVVGVIIVTGLIVGCLAIVGLAVRDKNTAVANSHDNNALRLTAVAAKETAVAERDKALTNTTPALPLILKGTATATPIPPTAAATPTPPSKAPVITGIAKGDTVDVPTGYAVLGDVIATWPGWDEVMAAYDNGQSGEGTILWVSAQTASVHAPWGAGILPCTSRTEAEGLVAQELASGCGDPGGCKTVRLVTLGANGTSVEFFDD